MNARGILFLGSVILGLVFPISAHADANLTVTPVTWNIVGLDSNSPASGPYRFPVGARVCNVGSTASGNVTTSFVWDDGQGVFVGDVNADPYINLRAGSLSSVPLGSIAAASCSDAYFEAEVTRVPAAYDMTRRYHVTATDSVVTGTSVQPRELYVEHLISQNRNSISDVKLNGVSVPAGGAMTLMVGNTYTIALVGGTATQGYSQFEAFINFPNTIFQVLSVSTTYSADNSPYVPNPNNKLYADACQWENDPNSPNYRSCVGGDYKAGGSNVVATYTVKILSGGGTSQTLNSLLYDFSGSSFHYNGDYSTGARIVNIVGPSSVTISKAFTPRAIAPNGTSVMSFKLANPTTETFTGVNFTDTLLGGLRVAATPGVTYDGCGSGAFSPALVADATSLSFSGGTLAPNSVCAINVNVTAPAGTYPNTTGHLYINTSVDTGNTGSDTLTASSAPACTPGQTLVSWTVPVGAANPPDTATGGAGSPTVNNTTYTATASALVPGRTSIDNIGQNDTASWLTYGYQTGNYVQFVVDTRSYSGVQMSFQLRNASPSNGPTTLTVSYDNGSGFLTLPAGTLIPPSTTDWTPESINFSGLTSTTGTTTFRIAGSGAKNDNTGAGLNYDVITFTGCAIPTPPPTITKTFLSDPIIKGSTSTLRFTVNNTSAGNKALTGIAFSDVLPVGLSIADSSTAQCAGTLTTTAATRTIALTGGALAAGGSCTINVTVTGTTEGQYDNITGYISSTQTGTSTNYATDSLTVIAPPIVAKSFSQTSILVGGTSSLAFTLTNPNQLTALSGIGFTDALPGGVTVANSGPTATCGGSLTTTSPGTISFSGGSLSANSSCTFSVPVTGTTVGTKNNTTSVVTSTEGGNGNAASATLVVSNPQSLLSLNKEISTDNTNWFKYVGVPLPLPRNVYYKFTVSNDGETTLNTVNVTDPNVNMVGCTPVLPFSLAVGASASCVVGPVSIVSVPAPNPFVNTATVTTSTYPPLTPIISSAKYGTKSLTIAKSVTESYFFGAGDVLHYSYVVTNNGGYPLAGPVTIADDKSTDETCPAVSTVGDHDNYLDPGESITCTATYTVQAADVTAGSVTNTATATVGGVTSPTDSKTVYLVPDLTVTKGNNVAGTVVLGNTFDWTLTVGNPGGSASFANGQTLLTDELPTSGASYSVGTVSKAGGTTGTINCTITSNTLTCTASGDVAIPSSGSFSVPVTVTPTGIGSLVNPRSGGTCAADPAGVVPESNEGNNNCSDTVTVTAAALSANLAITKTDGVTSVTAGGTTIYTIVVSNLGPSGANGAIFTDPAVSNLTVTGVSCGSASGGAACPTVANTTVALMQGSGIVIPTLPNGGSVTFSVTGTAGASGSIVNVATIATPTGVTDPTPGNNSATDTDTIDLSANLAITKTDGVTSVTAGGTTTYTIVVSNVGPSAANGAIFTDPAVSNLTVTGVSCGSPTGGAACPAAGSTTVALMQGSGIVIPTLPNGGSVTFSVTGTAGASGSIVNVASIAAPSGVTDPTPGNNSATDTDTIDLSADLSITKTHTGNFTQGQTGALYTITVTNLGPVATSGTVTVTDTLPTELTATAISGTGWSCTLGTLTCTRSDVLAASASYPAIALTVDVESNAPASVTNTAIVSGGGELNTGNDTATDPTTIISSGGPNLYDPPNVTKTVDGNGLPVLRYTAVLINSGNGPALGVVFTDSIPQNTIYVANSITLNGVPVSDPSGDADGGFDQANNRIVVNISTINPGSQAVIAFSVSVNSGFFGTVSNQGRVSGSNVADRLTDDPGTSPVNDPTNFYVGAASRVAVPMLNEWGFFILLTLSGLVSLYHLRRQRKME